MIAFLLINCLKKIIASFTYYISNKFSSGRNYILLNLYFFFFNTRFKFLKASKFGSTSALDKIKMYSNK